MALDEADWRERERRHRDRVKPWTAPRSRRRSVGASHPVDDFLFDYYPYSVAKLLTWHPGHGTWLLGDVRQFLGHPDYRAHRGGATTSSARLSRARPRLDMAVRLLERTADREPSLGCFGMHEWAMTYRLAPGDVRHAAYPLRLTPDEIVDTVDTVGLRCTHIDAYRFFTPAAAPLNAHRPTRSTQHEWEQPGCLHANMDLYKYAMWFQQFVGSDLVADCFEVARKARELDMRAAPYDLADLGYEPIRVETPDGRREYADEQRALATAAAPLRSRLLAALSSLRGAATDAGGVPASR